MIVRSASTDIVSLICKCFCQSPIESPRPQSPTKCRGTILFVGGYSFGSHGARHQVFIGSWRCSPSFFRISGKILFNRASATNMLRLATSFSTLFTTMDRAIPRLLDLTNFFPKGSSLKVHCRTKNTARNGCATGERATGLGRPVLQRQRHGHVWVCGKAEEWWGTTTGVV